MELIKNGMGAALAAVMVGTAIPAGAVKVTVNVADIKAEVPRTLYGTGM